MTPQQEKVLERLKRDILLHDGLGEKHVDNYEYKRWEVKEDIFTTFRGKKIFLVFLSSEVGGKRDEGTLASVFCRTRRFLHIGMNGGVKSLVGRKVSGYHKVLIQGYEH